MSHPDPNPGPSFFARLQAGVRQTMATAALVVLFCPGGARQPARGHFLARPMQKEASKNVQMLWALALASHGERGIIPRCRAKKFHPISGTTTISSACCMLRHFRSTSGAERTQPDHLFSLPCTGRAPSRSRSWSVLDWCSSAESVEIDDDDENSDTTSRFWLYNFNTSCMWPYYCTTNLVI